MLAQVILAVLLGLLDVRVCYWPCFLHGRVCEDRFAFVDEEQEYSVPVTAVMSSEHVDVVFVVAQVIVPPLQHIHSVFFELVDLLLDCSALFVVQITQVFSNRASAPGGFVVLDFASGHAESPCVIVYILYQL